MILELTAWKPGMLCKATLSICTYRCDGNGVGYAAYICPGETFLILGISEYRTTDLVFWKATLLLSDGLIVWCKSDQLFTTEPVTQC